MNETQQLENYLLGGLSAEDRLLIEAQLLINRDLRRTANLQKLTYALVQNYGRKKLKADIQAAQKRLFTETRFSSFRKTITSIFKS